MAADSEACDTLGREGEGLTLYVSTDGDDIVHSGWLAAPMAGDGPLASLTAARDALRGVRRRYAACGRPAPHARVYVRSGTYRLTKPLTLTAEDSDTEWLRHPADSANPIHSGGARLSGEWQREVGGAWSLRLDKPFPFNQLWVDGKRAVRAREPEQGGYYRMAVALPSPLSELGFVAEPADLRGLAGYNRSGQNSSDVVPELVIFSSWQANRRHPSAVLAHNSTVLLASPASIDVDPYANSGSRYYFENYREACDSAGEWFYDGARGELLWQPRSPDEPHPSKLTFEAPRLTGPLLRLENTTRVTVANLSFEHTDWGIAAVNTSSGTVQEASFLAEAAVHLRNATHCRLEGVAVERVGAHGIWIEGGSSHNTVRGCLVRDTAAGGIRVGRGKPLINTPDGTAHTAILDSTVVHGGAVFPGAGGIIVQKVSHTLVQNCEVAYFNAHGISVGWTWDYRPSEASQNTVRDCYVHHLGNGVLSDLAGVYLLVRIAQAENSDAT